MLNILFRALKPTTWLQTLANLISYEMYEKHGKERHHPKTESLLYQNQSHRVIINIRRNKSICNRKM